MAHKELIGIILRYLLKHPDAGDTLDGITQWWLLNEKTEWKAEEVIEVLEFLVSKQLLIEKKMRGSSTIYLVNKHRLAEIRNLLNGGGSKLK